MLFSSRSAAALIALLSTTLASTEPININATTLPIINLGYVNQRATTFNETGQYYNFSNIRYGCSPVGNLRFRAPQPPLTEDPALVATGEIGRICPQADGSWVDIARQFLPRYLQGETIFGPSDFNTSTGSVPIQDPRATEDCLFLDAHVPKRIFDERQSQSNDGAAVLEGSKTDSGTPAGLISRSQNDDNSGIIFVSLNYRLGAFGWLSGSTFQEDGTANAGLYDQRLALEWIQNNIAKFGGNPKRVTVIGESAGGGSIMHQLTAYGDSTPAPFQQAILQSPGWYPSMPDAQQENTFNDFLSLLNVSMIDEARNLPYQALQAANQKQVSNSPCGQYTFGPAVDGTFVPQPQGQMFAKGLFAPNVLNVMVGLNTKEGTIFTSPYIQNDTAFESYVTTMLPSIAPRELEYLLDVFYPSQDWPNQIARAAQFSGDAVINCKAYFVNKAFNNETYAYLFAVPPALHGDDIAYTFYNDDGPTQLVTAPGVAVALQQYIISFVKHGSPGGIQGLPSFSKYGTDRSIQLINNTGITQGIDEVSRERCTWWQKSLYL